MSDCFSCTGCGKCCTGSPGYVFVSPEEIEKIAHHLDISVADFSKKYVRVIGARLSLKETLPHYDCVFFKDRKCLIYEVRPTQCRTYPFWPMHLENEAAWEAVKEECEGINRHAPLPMVAG